MINYCFIVLGTHLLWRLNHLGLLQMMHHLTEASIDLVVSVASLKKTELHCTECAGTYQLAGPQQQELIAGFTACVVCLDDEGRWHWKISLPQNCRGLVHCMALMMIQTKMI